MAAAAALQFALAPPQPAPGLVWLHLCGQGGPIPLSLPMKGDGRGQAACHAGCALAAEKKKPRGRV